MLCTLCLALEETSERRTTGKAAHPLSNANSIPRPSLSRRAAPDDRVLIVVLWPAACSVTKSICPGQDLIQGETGLIRVMGKRLASQRGAWTRRNRQEARSGPLRIPAVQLAPVNAFIAGKVARVVVRPLAGPRAPTIGPGQDLFLRDVPEVIDVADHAAVGSQEA